MEQHELDELEQEVKYQIIRIEDEETEKSAFSEYLDEINQKFEEFKIWLEENYNSPYVEEKLAKLKEESFVLIEKAKQKAEELKESEKLKSFYANGKVLLEDTSEKIKEGVQDALSNKNVSKIVGQVKEDVSKVSDKVDEIYHGESVQKNVRKIKKGTLKAAQTAYEGLKRLLDDEEESKS